MVFEKKVDDIMILYFVIAVLSVDEISDWPCRQECLLLLAFYLESLSISSFMWP